VPPSDRHDLLLSLDAVVNLVLGAVLLAAPLGSLPLLGLPDPGTRFYATILGAVLFGIGLALLLEARRGTHPHPGLGLAGAVMINLCGGLALLGWLIFGRLDVPARGMTLMWLLVIVVLVIGLLELRPIITGWKAARK
jgi:hypothetical protein